MLSQKPSDQPHKRNYPFIEAVYHYDDACALGMAYASGEADPVEIAHRCLEMTSKYGTVYLSTTPERALAEAQASRARYQGGQPLSLFDGVPLNWKDTFDVAGTVTTAGSALFCDDLPAQVDGPLSQSAAQAGMVCIGKVNSCEFAYSSVGVNRHFGSPINPHSPPEEPRTCGGSSSGSAASVAGGLIPLSMGSDAGGSIRIPASFTGICGFKPTSGHYPGYGMKALARTLDSPGPMARSVRDLFIMDCILRGEFPTGIPHVPELQGTRFRVDFSIFNDIPVADAVIEVLERVIRSLEKAGATVERRILQPFHDARKSIANGWSMGAEVFTELKEMLDDSEKASRMDQRIRKRAEFSRNMPPHILVQSYWDRLRLMNAMRDDLDGAVFILPSVAYTAPLLRPLEADDEAFALCVQANPRLTAAGSFLNMPAVALPAGADEKGLPIGVSLYGVAGEDKMLLRSALAVEAVIT